MLDPEDFRSIQTFVAVVEEESFVGAARRLGLTPSAVSKQIARLERRLGVRLLQRTTRSLSLTEEGARYHQRCTGILSEFEAAEREVTAIDPTPRGLLRITAPSLLGHAFVAPVVAEFQQQYPEIVVDLDLNDRLVDIVEESFDIAIRSSAQLPSSSMVARKLAPHEFILCASPGYLKAEGTPRRPADLQKHQCLVRRGTDRRDVWTLVKGSSSTEVAVKGRFYSNSRMAVYRAVLAGCGIGSLPAHLVQSHLQAGELVHVLPGYRFPKRFVYAIYAYRQPLPGRVRVFLDFILPRAQVLLGELSRSDEADSLSAAGDNGGG